MNHKHSVVFILISIALALVGGFSVVGLLTTSVTIGSSGSITTINIEAYLDSGCTQPAGQIVWGALDPGESIDKTIYLKNDGNAPLTLSMSPSNWNPSGVENFLTITWDSEGEVINSGTVMPVTLTLVISESVTGITDYGFNIVIEGTS